MMHGVRIAQLGKYLKSIGESATSERSLHKLGGAKWWSIGDVNPIEVQAIVEQNNPKANETVTVVSTSDDAANITQLVVTKRSVINVEFVSQLLKDDADDDFWQNDVVGGMKAFLRECSRIAQDDTADFAERAVAYRHLSNAKRELDLRYIDKLEIGLRALADVDKSEVERAKVNAGLTDSNKTPVQVVLNTNYDPKWSLPTDSVEG
jgi:hypothetical protein